MPIESFLPMPDPNLSDPPNKNIKYFYGPYIEIPFCSSCGYYQIPAVLLHPAQRPTNVCRNCGRRSYIETIGRYKIQSELKGFIFKRVHEEIIGFEPITKPCQQK